MKATPGEFWKAGAAATVITPGEPMWLAGWAARREPAHGQQMELFAKALALEDSSGNRVVLVTADLLAIPRTLASAVAAKVQAQRQLPRQKLLFNASHTHTAPEVRPDKVPFFEIPEEYAARIEPYVLGLEEKFTAVVGVALNELRPAKLRVIETRVGFARNRRSAAGPADPSVPVLEATSAEGKPIAILFGLACHNLTLPPGFCRYHGDYAGVAQKLLEGAFPGARALFLAGAGADQDPDPRGTLELAEAHGRELARAVQQGLSRKGREVSGPLRVGFEEVALDFQPLPAVESLKADAQSDDAPRARKARFLLQALDQEYPFPSSYPCPVQVLRFGGELLLVALGGEPVVDYALNLKAEFGGPLVWVAGYSNDLFGYLPNRRVLREGGYEGGRSLYWSALPASFNELSEERVMEAVRRLAGL